MNSTDDYFSTPSATIPKPSRGGARANAGPKPKSDMTVEKDANGRTAYQRYEIARAEREAAAADREVQLARQAKVKADLDEEQVVDRQSVRDASARAFATCSQAMDSIGDILEREGFAPDLCERVMQLVNSSKAKLAEDLERAHLGAA